MTITHVLATPQATYTPAVIASGLVFTAGQVGTDERGEVPSSFPDEVRLALANLESVLASAGAGLDQLVKVTCYIADVDLVPVFNKVYHELIPEPRPARATVQVRMIAPYRIELDCVAALA
jgi:2-iminobutanoate/2-iminopropanoate deaminase